MPIPKSQLYILLITLMLVGGGVYYWFNLRETSESATQKLAAQGIDVSQDGFFAEIKADHTANIHNFLMAGADPGIQDSAGVSALMAAVQTGDKKMVATLLAGLPGNPQEAAKVINLQETADNKTALLLAVDKKNADIVNELLAYGADTEIADTKEQTPLIAAVIGNGASLIPLLIAADAHQHQGATINAYDKKGETALTYAIRLNYPDSVDKLIAAKADAVSPDRGGVTPLMVAAETGNPAIAAKLLAAGARPDVADNQGNTPLAIAIRHAHPEFARFLIDKGASADFHTSGPLPLQLVIGMQPFNEELFNYILARSKQKTIDASLLFDAIDQKNATLVKALLGGHSISARALNDKNETLLYHAIENGMEDAAITLIDEGVDTDQTGIPGVTPLERATKHNEINVVEKLLSKGISPDQKTSEGYTLAEMAVYSGHPEILDLLLSKHARLGKDFSILWAIRDGGGRAVPVLLKYGANPNVMSNSGDPALWLAASGGETEAVTALIKFHAALDYPNAAQAMTPLAIASHSGQLPVVKLLVEAGAKLETPDAFGMTPLAHAAYMTKPDVVEYLISKGANVHATDKQGRSIADLAALGASSNARDRVLFLLLQKDRRN